MIQPKKNPSAPVDYESLNTFLLGTMAEAKRKEITSELADSISKLADKVVKNNLTAIMDKNRRGDKSLIPFFETEAAKILIENANKHK